MPKKNLNETKISTIKIFGEKKTGIFVWSWAIYSEQYAEKKWHYCTICIDNTQKICVILMEKMRTKCNGFN